MPVTNYDKKDYGGKTNPSAFDQLIRREPVADYSKTDDIDLVALLQRGIRFFKGSKWIFLVAVTLGLLLGVLKYISSPTVYRSRMVLLSTELSNQNNIQIAGNWSTLLKEHEYASLAALFNTDENILRKVKRLRADEIQKIFTPNNPNGFIIEVLVTDGAVLGQLQRGIVQGFDNSAYVSQRLVVKREQLADLIGKTQFELLRLDSIKKNIGDLLSGKAISSTSFVVDASNISRQIVELNEKLQRFREELRFSSAVKILQGFNNTSKPAGPNLLKNLLLGFLAGLVMGYIIAVLRYVSRRLTARAAF